MPWESICNFSTPTLDCPIFTSVLTFSLGKVHGVSSCVLCIDLFSHENGFSFCPGRDDHHDDVGHCSDCVISCGGHGRHSCKANDQLVNQLITTKCAGIYWNNQAKCFIDSNSTSSFGSLTFCYCHWYDPYHDPDPGSGHDDLSFCLYPDSSKNINNRHRVYSPENQAICTDTDSIRPSQLAKCGTENDYLHIVDRIIWRCNNLQQIINKDTRLVPYSAFPHQSEGIG